MRHFVFVALVLIALVISHVTVFACAKVSGDILYSGDKQGSIIIASFSIPPDLDEPLRLDTLQTSGYYYLNGFYDPGTFFFGAFMDVNGDGFPGLDEPVGFYPSPIVIGNHEVDNSITITGINITLQELPRGAGSISGTVNYIGAAQGDVHVYALGSTMTPFTSQHFQWGSGNTFHLDGLMNGHYIVVAYIDQNGNGIPDPDEPVGAVTNLLTLREGQHMTGLQLTLLNPEIRDSGISGTIQYAGAQQGPVYIAAAGLSHTPINITMANPVTGDYSLSNLGNGDYLIFAFMDANRNSLFDLGEPFSETYINKLHLDTYENKTGVDITLVDRGTASIEGTVSCENGGFGLITIAALGLSTTPLSMTALLMPGQYRISNLAPGYYTVGGYQDRNFDLRPNLNEPVGFYTEDVIEVLPGAVIKGIDFRLTSLQQGIISGLISLPGRINGSVYVVAMGLSSTPFSVQAMADNGSYQIGNLAAGKYITAAFVDSDGDGVYSAGEPMAYSPRLITVTGLSETANVNLEVKEDQTTGLASAGQEQTPAQFRLLPNYPNPFNPNTTIGFELDRATHVTVKIFNIRGEEVATLVDGIISAGTHHVEWDASGLSATQSSGIYLCKLTAGGATQVRKMTLLK